MTPRSLPFLLASLSFAAPLHADVIERVVAKVNSEILTLSEFEARQVAAVQAARVGPESVERFLRENNQRILQEAIDDLLLQQRAKELGLRVRPEYLDEIIEGIKKDNGITSEEAFQEQLRREGLSLDELRRSIERSVVRRQVVSRELETRVAISESEALAEFQAHKAEYGQPASVRLQEILVEGDDALARATALLARLRAGEDFAALARDGSAGPTARDGGELGKVARGDLAADIDEVVFALPAGGVSEPLRTANGYRILKVAEKTEAQAPSFETARPRIVQRLTQERAAEQYKSYIEGLRKSAGAIEIRVREVPLQVTVPTGPSLAAPAAAEPPAPSGAEGEIVTTPQARPERVAPPPLPSTPTPEPTPPPPGA
jgi:peptidyl-prolyl cis-trans isomerase SurA